MRNIFALLVLLSSLPLAAQDGPPLKTQQVSEKIYMISGRGGNIGVSVGADGLLMVDDKFADLADAIRAELKTLSADKLAFLLNTHYHGDHTGSNESFGGTTPIIAHDNVRTRSAMERRRGDEVTPGAPPAALPVITFDHSLSIHFNGEEIKVLHAPHANTDGDAVIFFSGSNVVHMGDTFFNARFPYVDIDSGGDVQGVIDAVKSVLATANADSKIIPGHGEIATPKELRTYLNMLEETRTAVAKGIKAGKTIEELQKAGLDKKWATWGDGFISTERWVATLYRSLAPK